MFTKITLLASGLGFPEGPVVMGDGRVVSCDGNTGELLVHADRRVPAYARTGGSPWGAVLGSDGAIYVTQGGNVPGSGDTGARVRNPAGAPDWDGRAAVLRSGRLPALRLRRAAAAVPDRAMAHRVQRLDWLPNSRKRPSARW
jgi:hypothetical protein